MIVKVSGCVLVFLSSFLIGISFKMYTKRRLASLENMLCCMQAFETEIRFSINDIISASEKLSEIAQKDNAIIFNSFLKNAKNGDGQALSDIWRSTIEEITDCVCYEKDDLKLYMEFGTVLGSGDVDTQLKNIDKLCFSLKQNIDVIKNKVSKNDDVFSKLGIYIGVLLVIVLI